MKFQIGDKIIVVETLDEGNIVSFISEEMAEVRVKNSTFPIHFDKIDHPYFHWFTNGKFKNTITKKTYIDNVPLEKKGKIQQVDMRGGHGMHLIFFPIYKKDTKEDIIEKVKIFLSNNQQEAYAFSYQFKAKSGENFKIDSEVGSFSEFYIHDISYEDIATHPVFRIACAEIISNINSGLNQFDDDVALKPKKLMELLAEMNEKENAFFQILLFNTNLFAPDQVHVTAWEPKKKSEAPKQIIFEKPIVPVPEPAPKIITFLPTFLQNPTEVDVHIEKLYEQHTLLSTPEIIDIQLSAVAKAIDNAIVQNLKSVFIIHGMGNGTLKRKIHEYLNNNKEVHSYVNQYDKKYGFGATEVFLEI